MTWVWASLFILVLTYLLQTWPWRFKKSPPGPIGFPIFGSLHLLGKYPHRDLRRLSEKYGPIMHMRLGCVSTIVVSPPQAAELFLKTHDSVFASRPASLATKYIGYGQKSMVFGQYGDYWRSMRKMCTLELLSSNKIASFKSMRSEEVGLLVAAVREAAGARAPVDVSAKVWNASVDMTFGSGRRVCPGIQLGLTVVRLVVAQLVHCFDWELPGDMLPTDLDMTAKYGISCPRANHLLAFPTYRLIGVIVRNCRQIVGLKVVTV